MLKIKHYLFCAICVALILPSLWGSETPLPATNKNNQAPDSDGYRSIALMMNVLQLVRENYVDKDMVSYDRLIKGALKGMLGELDPYSAYETPDHYSKTVEDTKGEFGGLGIVVTNRNNILEVVAPMEDTPGFKAGIIAGDIITEIDGKQTRGMDLFETVNLLKGPPGTKVNMTIYRKAENKFKKVTIERAVIEVSPVKGPKIIDSGIGYIRLTQFSVPLPEKLDEALASLKKKNMRALILDLRGNPGGLMGAAIQVCSRFIEEGKVVVSTAGRKESEKQDFRSLYCDKTLDIPMLVLVDGNSASAAEIVAGCLQDHKRAVLLGEKTFGKASIQSLVPLGDKSAVRLTTGKYFTPDKKLIHGIGIQPDIKVKIPEADEMKLAVQRSNHPGEIAPNISNAVRDVQLQRAVEVLKGICVYSAKKND
ncbi:MAG: hypothetical protein A2017_10455 [Lentisphaerae bacterium GWF2_44_16]|nr:MAG: hypothetical protein A2017_10455 [Lentisphaerae bacterium GWF2_44_16]